MDSGHIGSRTAAVALTVFLSACATYGGYGIVPGQSTAQDVRSIMGTPTDKIGQPDRSETWFYSRQPLGRQTIAVRMTGDGIVRAVEPVLNYTNLAKVVIGQTTREQLRATLGPPNRIERMQRQQQDSWEYWMVLDSIPVHVWILLSDDGMVRDIVKSEDLPRARDRRR